MHIGIISQWFDPEGGSAAVPGSIARSLQRRGHTVDVLTTFPNYPTGRIYPGFRQSVYKKEIRHGVCVHRVPHFPYHGESVARRSLCYLSFAASSSLALRSLKNVDAILVYSTPVTTGIPATINSYFKDTPIVTYVQDLWPETFLSSGLAPGGSAKKSLLAMAEHLSTFAYARSDAVAVNSPGMDSLIRRHLNSPALVRVIPNWVDESLLATSPNPDAFRQAWSLREPNLITYAGNLGHAQDALILVKLAEELREQPDTRIVVIGDGILAAELKQRVAQLRLENISLLGQLALNEIPSAISASVAQIVTLSADPLFGHTLPSKVQFSLALGRPIVAAVSGDPRQVLQSSGAALVVEPGDAVGLAQSIRVILGYSDAERAKLGHLGRQTYLDLFSETVGATSLESLIFDALRARSHQ